MNFPENIEIPDGFELIIDDNYIVKSGDLYYKRRFGNNYISYFPISGWAGRTLGQLKIISRVLYVAKKTGIMKPYFPENKEHAFPHGF